MKQKVVILTCVGIFAVSMVLTLLFRFVWTNSFWTKFCFALLGASGLLTVILQFGRKNNRK